MTKLLIRLAASAGAVLLVQWALQQPWALQYLATGDNQPLMSVSGWVPAIVFAVVLGVLNAVLRPILLFVTCPFNLLTLGLFTFVVNAVVFWLAAQFVSGIDVRGFAGALIGSLAVTICTAIVDRFLEQ